jgi:IMP dehydrogenase
MNMQALTFDDILLVPNYNHYESRKLVDISVIDRTGKLKLSVPILSANMDTITEFDQANYMASKGGMGVLHRFMSIEANIEQYRKCQHPTFISVGCSEKEIERGVALWDEGATYFCVDVAHGHAKYVGRTIKKLRELFGDNACLMAGNVCTYAGADYLASCGADIIKVGIGPGSACTTRIKTGFGMPQLSAIKECTKADRSIVADGGIRTAGDIVKALAFGADFVMLGGMLSGTHYTPGKPLEYKSDKDGNYDYKARPTLVKAFRGMASKEVADEKLGGLTEWKTAEGVSTYIPYKDEQETEAIIQDIVGGLRSGLTYGGSTNIRELQRKLNYVVITNAGRAESLPHILPR